MTTTLYINQNSKVEVSGGTERKPVVMSVIIPGDDKRDDSEIDIVDFGHRKRGYICESSPPSDHVTAIKGHLVTFRHQHTGREFSVGGGD